MPNEATPTPTPGTTARSDHYLDRWQRAVAQLRDPEGRHLLASDAYAVAQAVASTARLDGTRAACSVDYVVGYTGLPRRTAERRLADLRRLGLCVVVARGGGRSRKATVYALAIDGTPAALTRERGASSPVDSSRTPATSTATPATTSRTPAASTGERGALPLPSVEIPSSPREDVRAHVAAPSVPERGTKNTQHKPDHDKPLEHVRRAHDSRYTAEAIRRAQRKLSREGGVRDTTALLASPHGVKYLDAEQDALNRKAANERHSAAVAAEQKAAQANARPATARFVIQKRVVKRTAKPGDLAWLSLANAAEGTPPATPSNVSDEWAARRFPTPAVTAEQDTCA